MPLAQDAMTNWSDDKINYSWVECMESMNIVVGNINTVNQKTSPIFDNINKNVKRINRFFSSDECFFLKYAEKTETH